MKKSLFTLLLIFNFFCLSAQENTSILKEEKEEYSFIDLEEIPIYPGCEDFERNKRMECFNSKVSKHLTATFKYPLKAFKKNIQGRVHVMFVINKEGEITNIETRGGDPILQTEALRIIKLLPKMKPGMQEGKPVNVKYSLPINFKLN